jgi:hypothetical protein
MLSFKANKSSQKSVLKGQASAKPLEAAKHAASGAEDHPFILSWFIVRSVVKSAFSLARQNPLPIVSHSFTYTGDISA